MDHAMWTHPQNSPTSALGADVSGFSQPIRFMIGVEVPSSELFQRFGSPCAKTPRPGSHHRPLPHQCVSPSRTAGAQFTHNRLHTFHFACPTAVLRCVAALQQNRHLEADQRWILAAMPGPQRNIGTLRRSEGSFVLIGTFFVQNLAMVRGDKHHRLAQL